jgi:hypothetical protein
MENTVTMKGIAMFATLIGVYQWLGQGTSFLDIMVLLFATALVISMDGGGQKHQSIQPVSDEKETGDNQNKKRGVFFCRLARHLANSMDFTTKGYLSLQSLIKKQNKMSLEPFYYYS